MKASKGFTLIELMIVIAIIAILFSIGAGAIKDNDGVISIDTEKLRDSLPCGKEERQTKQSSDEGYTIEE